MRAEAVESRPEPLCHEGGRRIDRGHLGIGVDFEPSLLGDRQERVPFRDDHVVASNEAHRRVRGDPDDVHVLRGERGARGIGHVRVGFEQQSLSRRRPVTNQEFREMEDPCVDPVGRGQVEFLRGDAVASAFDDDRVQGGHGKKTEGAFRLRRILDPVAAERHLSCRHPGDEAPAACRRVRAQLDGEDVQIPLFHEVNARGIVHRKRPMRPGLDPDAADTFNDGDVVHRVNPT